MGISRKRSFELLIVLMLAALAILASAPAFAQATFPTAASGVRAGAVVPLQCDASQTNCAPASATNPVPTAGPVASGGANSLPPVKIGCVYNTAAPTVSNGTIWECQSDSSGAIRVNLSAAGSSALSGSAIAEGTSNALTRVQVSAQPLLYNGSTWDKQKKPVTVARLLSAAATTNSTLVKNSAADVFMVEGQTIKAAAVYIKLYNKATAPTCGTDTPVATFYAAASSHFTFSWPTPLLFPTGLGFCITAAAADADTTALVAGDVVALNLLYN